MNTSIYFKELEIMKRFVLAAVLSCFCGVVCPNASIIGMQNKQPNSQERDAVMAAQRLFNVSNTSNTYELYSALCDIENKAFSETYRDSWREVINAHINDPAYTEALGDVLIFAATGGWNEGVRMILNSSLGIVCTNTGKGNNLILEMLSMGKIPESDMIDILNTILELRPDSDFAEPYDNEESRTTPLIMAVSKNKASVVEWLLALHTERGKDINPNHIIENDEMSALGYAVYNGNSEIVRILINHVGPDGNYDVEVEHTDKDSLNVLTQALEYFRPSSDVINTILDSGRIGLDSIVDTLRFNQAGSLSVEILRRLRDMATAARLSNVLSALDVYRFWRVIEDNELNTARALLTSENLNMRDAIAQAITSGELALKEDDCVKIRNMAAELQLQPILHAFNIYDFREALRSKDENNVQALLTSGRVNYDDIIMVLSSEDDMLPLPIYRSLMRIAQNAERQDVIQALLELDRRVFQAMVDNYAWRDVNAWKGMIELLQTERLALSLQRYNDIRRSIVNDLQHSESQNDRRTLQCQVNQLDFCFLRSRFTPQRWNELPNLLDSHCFDNLIRTTMPHAVFNGLRNLALQAQQQAQTDQNQEMNNLLQRIIDKLDQIRGNRVAAR